MKDKYDITVLADLDTQKIHVKVKENKLHIKDPVVRAHVKEITCRLLQGMVSSGEVSLDNPEELKRAVAEAANVAWTAYQAAEEYLCG